MESEQELQGENKEFLKDDTTEAHDITDAPHGVSSDSQKHPVGLKNQGSTCYLNTLLQCLFFTNKFRKAVCSMSPKNDDPNQSVLLALQGVFDELEQSNKPVSTGKLTKLLEGLGYKFGRQEDVHEFLLFFLKVIQKEINDEEGIIRDLFQGEEISHIRCKHVEYEPNPTPETFYDIKLNVKGNKNVKESFEDYIAKETLEGKNKYNAGEHGLQEAEKWVRFATFPPVLFLYLMRYDCNSEKINDRYEFPYELNLDSYHEDREDTGAQYTLHSVFAHSGDSEEGHYIGFINTNTEDKAQWFKFDDDNVTRCTQKDAIDGNFGGHDKDVLTSTSAYMLVYIRDNLQGGTGHTDIRAMPGGPAGSVGRCAGELAQVSNTVTIIGPAQLENVPAGFETQSAPACKGKRPNKVDISQCPMCAAKSPTERSEEVTSFKWDDNSITLQDLREVQFNEAITKYLDENFRHLSEESYRIPAVFSYDENTCFHFVSDEDVYEMAPKKVEEKKQQGEIFKGHSIPKEILKDRRQKGSVEKVVNAFHLHGKKTLGPLFVLSEFKYSCIYPEVSEKKTEQQKHNKVHQANNKKNSKKNNKKNNMKNNKRNNKSKGKFSKNIKDIENAEFVGDHDILIVSYTKGVIFVQVKGGDSTKTYTLWKKLKKAFEQTLKDAIAMKCMNKDLGFIESLPMTGFVSLPDLTYDKLSRLKICSEHRDFLLTASDLPKDKFSDWLSKRFTRKVKNELTLSFEDYKLLVGRYVGLASTAKSKTMSDAVDNIGKKFSRLLLSPEQITCLQSNAKKNIIVGDYGSGKSLLLIKKAEQIAKMGGRVYVISFSTFSGAGAKVSEASRDNLVTSLQQMDTCKDTVDHPIIFQSFLDHVKHVGKINSLTSSPAQSERFFEVTPHILCKILEESAKKGNIHFFLDEVPLGIMELGGGWGKFEKFCKSYENTFLWMSIATTSLMIRKDNGLLLGLNEPPGPSFQRTCLKQCHRTTKSIFNLVQAIREFKNHPIRKQVQHGNAIPGNKPWWLEMGSCSCEDLESPFECKCVGKERLKRILNKLMEKLDTTNREDITILLHATSPEMTTFLAKIVVAACEASGYTFKLRVRGFNEESCGEEGLTSALTISDLWSHKGNENKVVIYVDPFGGPVQWFVKPPHWQSWPDICLAASRTLVQFIVVTWPIDEIRKFEDNLRNWYTNIPTDEKTKESRLYRETINDIIYSLQEGRSNHSWKKSFMEYLLSVDVIEKIE